MEEEAPEGKHLHYRLYLPKGIEDTDFIVDAQYADVKMRVSFTLTEGGIKNLRDAFNTFPNVVKKALEAQTVRKETANLDTELNDLLGETE